MLRRKHEQHTRSAKRSFQVKVSKDRRGFRYYSTLQISFKREFEFRTIPTIDPKTREMMYFFPAVIAFALLVQGSAFLARPTRPARSSLMKMAVIDDSFPGQSAPFGLFDPLGLSKGASEGDLKRWRESELKHGRYDLISPALHHASTPHHH